MLVTVGMELNNEGRALAWALDFPGCFAYGSDATEAIVCLAQELAVYDSWVRLHGGPGWISAGNYDLRIVDTWQVFTMNDQYEMEEGSYAVNAWFRNDWKPLQKTEIERGLDLLRWSRADLLRTVTGLDDALLDREYDGERWSIRGILKHVANAEWWYLERLTLAEIERNLAPRDSFERLSWTRARLEAILPGLAGKELVIGRQGEFWSPRKLLRRALWHEMDHRRHILKLLELK